MALLRLSIFLLAGFLASASMAEDKPEDLIRLGFLPPLGEDIVYRVEQRSELTFQGKQKITEWSHELTLRLTAKEPPDLLAGTFTLGAVTTQQGGDTDMSYLFARAIEGESFALKMLEAGAPVEVDWPAIKNRIGERLPTLADPALADAIGRVIHVFDSNAVLAVMRPFWATSVAYLRGFRRDGAVTVAEGLELPAWFPVPGSKFEIYGGRNEGSEDLLLVWRVTPDPAAAAETLGPELVSAAVQAAGPAEAEEMRADMEAAIASGVTAAEGGIAVYDLTPGLMRSIEFETRLSAHDISRHIKINITRLKPE